MTLYLVCDETGSKGFSDKQERFMGEFGLFVGLLLNDTQYVEYLDLMNQIQRDYFQGIDKVHIADARQGDHDVIRQTIYGFVQNNNIPVIYEGIYSQGFHDSIARLEEMRITTKDMTEKQGDIKVTSREIKESLHVDLFTGLLNRAIVYYEDNHSGEDFVIISNPVDRPILASFKRAIEELVTLGQPRNGEAKGYIPSANMPVRSPFTFSIAQNPFLPNIDPDRIDLRIESKTHALGPDVVANSLEYHIRTKNEERVGQGEGLVLLNGEEAICNHSLENNFKFVGDYFGDIEFKHKDS